jgi:hypothetical protein
VITFSELGKFGRLGNQLFQIASLIGIAHENKTNFCLPYWPYQEYFSFTFEICKTENFQKKNVSSLRFLPIELLCNQNYNLFGYFQSYKYFQNIDIKEYLTFNSLKRDSLIKEYNFKDTISIHVRRGDYQDLVHVYHQITDQYIYECLSMSKNQNILVFSDDMDWCKKNLNLKEYNTTYIENKSDIEDLIIMSECENNIISNSTFSWWAAYLNKNKNKKIFCPDKWYNTNNIDFSEFIYDDLIPNDWIKVKS